MRNDGDGIRKSKEFPSSQHREEEYEEEEEREEEELEVTVKVSIMRGKNVNFSLKTVEYNNNIGRTCS